MLGVFSGPVVRGIDCCGSVAGACVAGDGDSCEGAVIG